MFRLTNFHEVERVVINKKLFLLIHLSWYLILFLSFSYNSKSFSMYDTFLTIDKLYLIP